MDSMDTPTPSTRTAVKVPTEVHAGIMAVRDSGDTNMFDLPAVVRLCREFGFDEVATWVASHQSDYARGIFAGFEAEDPT